MDNSPTWQTTVVAVAFIALVGVMFWKAAEEDFATIWAGVGTVVGVITGAIPSYFFRAQAQETAAAAEKAKARAEALSAVANTDQVEAARDLAPEAFKELGAMPGAT